MRDPIEAYMRAHVALIRGLLDGRPPQVGFATTGRYLREIAARHGETATDTITARTRALMLELFDGAPPPRLANARIDPWGVVEADIIAERLAEEYRRAGVRRSADPQWRVRLCRGYEGLLAAYKQ